MYVVVDPEQSDTDSDRETDSSGLPLPRPSAVGAVSTLSCTSDVPEHIVMVMVMVMVLNSAYTGPLPRYLYIACTYTRVYRKRVARLQRPASWTWSLDMDPVRGAGCRGGAVCAANAPLSVNHVRMRAVRIDLYGSRPRGYT